VRISQEVAGVNQSWGFCKDCKWWQIERDASLNNLTMGLSVEEKLQPFLLRVRGERM
jgi:hypothetical protein